MSAISTHIALVRPTAQPSPSAVSGLRIIDVVWDEVMTLGAPDSTPTRSRCRRCSGQKRVTLAEMLAEQHDRPRSDR